MIRLITIYPDDTFSNEEIRVSLEGSFDSLKLNGWGYYITSRYSYGRFQNGEIVFEIYWDPSITNIENILQNQNLLNMTAGTERTSRVVCESLKRYLRDYKIDLLYK